VPHPSPTASFIRAAEVWTPSDDGSLLVLASGAFGAARRFAAISRQMCFGRGEGLPGRAWDEGRPVLLKRFDGANFRRTDAAHAAGFSCAVALPLFVADAFSAVLVVFCGHAAGAASALELWHHDARVTTDMTLVDGAYGPGAQDFESISHETYLPRGVGLPGLAWQRGEAVFVEELPASTARFVRAAQAAEAGMRRGLAIPVGSRVEDGHVVAFLAGATLPLAQRIERWVPDRASACLRRAFAFSELHGRYSNLDAEVPLTPAPPGATASIVQAWSSGVPAINEQPVDEVGAPAAAAASVGARALLAIPVVWDGAVVEVVALYL
jgi:hypothetical protein